MLHWQDWATYIGTYIVLVLSYTNYDALFCYMQVRMLTTTTTTYCFLTYNWNAVKLQCDINCSSKFQLEVFDWDPIEILFTLQELETYLIPRTKQGLFWGGVFSSYLCVLICHICPAIKTHILRNKTLWNCRISWICPIKKQCLLTRLHMKE